MPPECSLFHWEVRSGSFSQEVPSLRVTRILLREAYMRFPGRERRLKPTNSGEDIFSSFYPRYRSSSPPIRCFVDIPVSGDCVGA